MATWVEDIRQALINLGGQATLAQIYEEVKRIRKAPLPATWKESIRERIESYSSDSLNFKGKDIFRKIGKGTWALREQFAGDVSSEEKAHIPPSSSGADTDFPKRPEMNPQSALSIASTPSETGCDGPKEGGFIVDNGLFSSEDLNFPLSESFDTVENLFRTIKEYRDYVHPDANSWEEYILEFFHILGFNTTKIAPRLIKLDILGENSSPKALIGIVHPGESLIEIISGIDWASYLFFASKHFQIQWGIVTNGCELRIYNFAHDQYQETSYWCDLDGLIKNERNDSFFTVYKIFEHIKGRTSVPAGHQDSLSERHILRREFWAQLLEKAQGRTSLHRNRRPTKDNWLSAGAGKTGIEYCYVVRMNDAHVELYIDRGDYDWNKEVFKFFLQNKEDIEKAFGNALDWQELENKRGSRIRFVIQDLGLRDQGRWPELQEKLISVMIRMQKSFDPYIRKIEI